MDKRITSILENSYSSLQVYHGGKGIAASLVKPALNFPICYWGTGATVTEALANLAADIKLTDDDIDPMAPNYAALGAVEPRSQAQDSRDAAGLR